MSGCLLHAALIPIYWNLAWPVRPPLPINPGVNSSVHRFGGFGVRWAAGLGAVALFATAAVAGLYVALESNPAQAQSVQSTEYTFNSALAYPTGLDAIVARNNKVVILSWTAPADTAVEGYQIKRKTYWDDDNFAVIVANTENDSTTYRDRSITVPGRYRYQVSMVQGTEISSSAENVTANVSLVAPTASAPTGPEAVDTPPSNAATKETALDELYRLEASLADAAAGCLLYEIDHAFSDGWTTWTTEMDGILCVPLRDLMLDNCVPNDLVDYADRFKYTVVSYAAGQPAFLSSHRGRIEINGRNYNRVTNQQSNVGNTDATGIWDNSPLVRYNHPNSHPGMDFVAATGYGEFNYTTDLIDGRISSGEDEMILDLGMLHDRLVAITKTEWFGQYYLPPANCHFNGDEPDTIADADTEITLATTKYGGKDPGQDIDVFYIDLVQDVEYEIHIEGLDPTSQDARLALDELDIASESNHSISEIEPRMKVLDDSGDRLALVLHGETKSFTPDATGRYYLKVRDKAAVRAYLSGVYQSDGETLNISQRSPTHCQHSRSEPRRRPEGQKWQSSVQTLPSDTGPWKGIWNSSTGRPRRCRALLPLI